MPIDITSQLATATAAVTLQPDAYNITTSVTCNVDLTMLSGAVITVPSGATLKLLGSLDAPVAQLFAGVGFVDLNRSRTPVAYGEWWGARIDDGNFDNIPAFNAAVKAHPVLQLLAGDYYIASTWKITQSSRTIIGAGSGVGDPNQPVGAVPNQGTRIVVSGGTADTMQVGTDTVPANGPNFFVSKVKVARIRLGRTIVPPFPAPGNEGAGAAGLRTQFLLSCRFEEIESHEHSTGFYVGGCVATFFDDCYAFRSLAGTGSGSSVYYGFFLNGRVSFGAAGGNASLYIANCNTTIGGAPGIASTIGIGLDGSFADTFITRFEATKVHKGILAVGVASNPALAVRQTGNLNLHITAPVIDQCIDRGIELSGISNYAAVEIVDPYVALGSLALAAIHCHDGGGNVNIQGGQLIGTITNAMAGSNGVGILGEAQNGIRATGTKIIGCKRPVAFLTCTGFDIAVDVNSPDQTASQAAISLTGCTRGRVVSHVRGKAGAFPQGVNLLGTANARVMIDVTGLDPAAITGGAANKLVINGASVSAVGASGTHFVTGVTG